MWNKETEEQMNKFIEIRNKSGKINGTEITILYNLIFNRQVKPTNCGSCIGQRFKELKQSFDNYLKQKEMALKVIDQLMMEGIIPEGAAVATNITDEIITTKKGRPKKKD